MQKINLSDLEMAQLREQLGRLPEPRGGRRQLHPLPTVLTIALAATLAGARGYLAISEYAARLTQPQLKRLRAYFHRCPPWRAKRRRVVPGSREATRDTRRAEGAKGDPKGASERGVQSYGRPVCSRNELAMLWRNAG